MSLSFPTAPNIDTGSTAQADRTQTSTSNIQASDENQPAEPLPIINDASRRSSFLMGQHNIPFQRSRSVKSDGELDLQGPLDIAGSVKSGGSINFEGDFIVRDKIDAYGAININGSVSSQ